MRAVCIVLAAVGGCALAAAAGYGLATGDPGGAGFVAIGPAPFYLAGLIGAFRGPGHRVATWLLACGALFAVSVCFDGVIVPVVTGSRYASQAWIAALGREWASDLTIFAAVGLIGLFPAGRAERRGERWALRVTAATAALLPLALAVTSPVITEGLFSVNSEPPASPLFLPAAAPVRGAVHVFNMTFPAWAILGVIMLYLRYRRSAEDDRRRIRLLLAGAAAASLFFAVTTAISLTPLPVDVQTAADFVAWPLAVVFALGPLLVALSQDSVLGIASPSRRTLVYRMLWLIIAAPYLAAAAGLGVVASHYLEPGAAVLLAVAATAALQPVQRRVERLADRWVFGDRLDGYELLSRFGAAVDASPGPAEMLPRLADTVRRGLGLHWARVRFDLQTAGGAVPAVGAAGIGPDEPAEPALVVPLSYGGTELGRIECGNRRAGPLVDEDKRLLTSLAGQVATAAHNAQLTAELTKQLEVIRSQTAELTASRARVARAQDTERQRIQRDLHDGVQQDVVALTAKLALARERLRRGDQRADESLAELQRELGDMLGHLRDFAHAIHPPVLADSGLLEAIEAQAARLPVEVMIEADAALRGVRYPQHVEAATWFVVAEALTNAVKHARASRVLVALTQPNGSLAVEVRDDGCGFDPAGVRGLGLASLADRISIVNGALRIDSGPGRGTTLRAEVPLATAEAAGQGMAAADG